MQQIRHPLNAGDATLDAEPFGMRIRLDYGKTGLNADFPDANLAAVLTLAPAPPLADPPQAIRKALDHPLHALPLTHSAQGKKSACIVVCDLTRPVPNAVLLPPLLEQLARAGIGDNAVTVLIATGTHRPNTPEEIVQLLGVDLAHRLRVVNHDCADKEAHRSFGTTPRGVPVFLDRAYTDADVRITVGLIEPHFMAGYSGGRKLVMPGIAALETIQAWHSPRFLEHPNARAGVVDQNPVHEENTYIAGLCPPDLMIDVTLDAARRITGVFAGHFIRAWQAGIAFCEQQARAVLSGGPADIVVTTGAGWPLDATYYQAVKGMVGALPVIKPGGDIIIASECSEGVGGPHFTRLLQQTPDLPILVKQMQAPEWRVIPDQWQVEELAKAVRHARIILVSALPPALVPSLHCHPAPTVEAALADAFHRHGSAARVVVVPKGPYVLAELESTPFVAPGQADVLQSP